MLPGVVKSKQRSSENKFFDQSFRMTGGTAGAGRPPVRQIKKSDFTKTATRDLETKRGGGNGPKMSKSKKRKYAS